MWIVAKIKKSELHLFKRELIKKFGPDVLGVSVVSRRLYPAYELFKRTKEILPNTTIIAGGPHINDFPVETMEATAIDFAYSVHTDIGHHCRGCRINRKLAPLSVPLESGQTIEILQDPFPQTSPAWLNFAVTARARNRIKNYLSNLKTSEAKKLGKKLLDQSLSSMNIKLRNIDKIDLRSALDGIGVRSLNLLLEEIGLGKRVGNVVAKQILAFLEKGYSNKDSKAVPLEITGSEGLVVNYAACCRPIPGDSVIGHFTTEKGLVVHQERCKNILSVREDPSQCFPLNWHTEMEKLFSTEIKVVAQDIPGLLATITSSIASADTNIEAMQAHKNYSGHIEFIFSLQVSDRNHLAVIIRKLRNLKDITSVNRVHDQEMREALTLH